MEKLNTNDKLDTLTCELWVWIAKELKYTRFISTKELEKLKTCHNIDELKVFFELEKKILSIIFEKNPNLKKENNFEINIDIDGKNEELLILISDFTTTHYILLNTKDRKYTNINWLKLYIEKNEKWRFYISNIEVINL